MHKSTKFLIAGLGSIGRRHFRNLISLGKKDIILLRTHKATLPDDELAGYPVESDLDEALKKHKPEAVIVANPTAMHLDIAIPAAQAGCSILMEKPVSQNLERFDELEAALEKGGGRLLVGFQFRFHPTLQLAMQMLKDGTIGRPLSFHAQWGEYLPNWHPWEDFRQGYAARSDLGGGVVLTLTHPLDYVRMLLGEVDSLWAFESGLNLGLGVEDAAEIGLRMASGAIGSVHLDFNQQPASHRWEIVCTKGTMRWDNATGTLDVFSTEKKDWEAHLPPAGFERNTMFLDEMKHFISVARKKEMPACNLEDGRRALQLALATHQSMQTEQIVNL
jgi:predicted dehydrogenase